MKLADQLQRASPLTERLVALRSYWPSWVSAAFVGYAVVDCFHYRRAVVSNVLQWLTA